MNILSAVSIIIYTSFFIGGANMLTAERKGVLNVSAAAVLMSLCWWSFCNSFFFAAATVEQAWFWHRLSSIGWCGFVALTAYYFLALTNYNEKIMAWWKKALFFLPTAILIGKNLFGKTTSLAQNIIQSTSGWGWTYENSITSFWLWAYLIYVLVYFCLAFYALYLWAKNVKHRMKRDMAVAFVILDTVTILLGVVTDVILPLTNPVLPALASVATAFFGVGYFTAIYKYDLFNINLVISSDDILQISNNSIFVTDENLEILRCSRAVAGLLGYGKNELIGENFHRLLKEKIDFEALYSGGELIDTEAKLQCKGAGVKYVLLSATAARDKHGDFLCFIISCQDVSGKKLIQEEMKIQREKYKRLANDYQQLAHYDTLTNLPNRRYFSNKLSEFEELYRSQGRDFAIIFLDLDNFKHANDIYGHGGGDELLIAAAGKLQSCALTEEFVARLGGDEFMLIMPYQDTLEVLRKMQAIKDEFERPIPFDSKGYTIGISAGYALFSQIGDITKLMEKADEAMYDSKKQSFSKGKSL
ncbi:MAG: diguanylate cyclase [Oscillospiraceae bacterium]